MKISMKSAKCSNNQAPIRTQSSQMAATKSLSYPPQSTSRQKGLVEGERTVMLSDQLPSVCFRRPRVSKQLGLTGCTVGCFVRNSIQISGETTQTYISQGQTLFENRKHAPCRFQTMCMGYILILILPVYLHKIVSFSSKLPYPLCYHSIHFQAGFILLNIGRQALFLFFCTSWSQLRKVLWNLETLLTRARLLLVAQTLKTTTQHQTKTCLEEEGFILGWTVPDAGVEAG